MRWGGWRTRRSTHGRANSLSLRPQSRRKKQLAQTSLDRPPSLDDFLPILIYVLIKGVFGACRSPPLLPLFPVRARPFAHAPCDGRTARVSHLHLNVQFIKHCRSPSRLSGEPSYYFINLMVRAVKRRAEPRPAAVPPAHSRPLRHARARSRP